MSTEFDVIDATIADIHAAYAAGTLTARKLRQNNFGLISSIKIRSCRMAIAHSKRPSRKR